MTTSIHNSNTTLVKVKFNICFQYLEIFLGIQIQHLLKLNGLSVEEYKKKMHYSNTTLVKVKFFKMYHWLGTKYQFKYNTC